MTAPSPRRYRPTASTRLPLRVGGYRAEALAALLRNARESRALSRDALASLAGLSTAAINDIEAGRGSPSIEAIWALTDALRMDAADLLHEVRRTAERLAVEAYFPVAYGRHASA